MIPLVDMEDAANFVAGLEKASHEIGFVYLGGHGIPKGTIERVRSVVTAYFSQSAGDKNRDRITRENYRGYIPLGFFTPNNGSGPVDRYEGFKLHYEVAADDSICHECDLYGPNKWPAFPVEFREVLLTYWRECDRVAAVLLAAFAEILGVSRDRFLSYFDYPLTNMTLLHYPPQPADADGVGIHPHKDTDVLTILAQDPVGGLQVRVRGSDAWVDARAPGDALTVNIGDLLELWSGGYLVSTPHRVVNLTGAERYSFPYFVVPRYDTIVAPFKAASRELDRAPVHIGEASREVWRSNWQDARPVSSELDPGMEN